MEVGKIPAVVLSAGYSSRMHAFKPLLPLGEGSVLEYVAKSLKGAGIKKVYLVTGHERHRLAPMIKEYEMEEVYNEDFDRGMFSSVKAGISAVSPWAAGCFLVPVDCPLFGEKTIEKMAETIKAEERFAVPVYRGKKGHPLYVPRRHFDEILRAAGGGGLKSVTDRYFKETLRIPVKDEGILLDMDTQKDYEALRAFLEGGKKSEELLPLAQNRRFILVRHGQIRQHRGKIFLGQTDIPLSEEGREQARKGAKKVLEMAPDTNRIYTSDLTRAKETAEILKETWQKERWSGNPSHPIGEESAVVMEVPGFREMSLGNWDGRYIDDIRCEEPEAYDLRGRHIWSYKKGNGSENFYDLQYRVSNALKDLLKKDGRKDIIIVAHKGVLRVVENNLKGKDVAEPWESMKNGEVRAMEL